MHGLALGDNIDMALTHEDKEWIGTQLRQVETGLRGEIGRVETNLLTAFRKEPSLMELRQRTRCAVMHMLDVEIEALNHRLKKLEPPAA